MKKLIAFLFLATPVTYAHATSDECTGEDCLIVASANYVKQAYDTLDTAKQAKLTTENVKHTNGSVTTGTGAVVTAVNASASGGEIEVSRSNVKIPNGGANATTNYSSIWIE